MKTFKRFSAILIAVFLMVSMMVIPASAATGNHSITISGATGHTFEAYQIFSGDLSGKVLSNIVWGDDVDSSALLTALGNADSRFNGATDAAGVAAVLEAETWTEADTIAFAKIVAKHTVAEKGHKGEASGSNYVIKNLAAGYYIVKDTTENMSEGDAYSRYIVSVTSDTAINIKNAAPTLKKNVSLTGESGFTKAVSAGLGNTVYFSLTAQMHARVSDYADGYNLKFEDTLPDGLTYEDVVAVYVNNTKLANTTSVVPGENNGNRTFTITAADAVISAATQGAAVSATDRITVVYSATLNGNDWKYGEAGNENTAVLHYSNNPADSTSMGTTAPAHAYVYTYQLELTKKDSSTGTTLANAEFIIYFADDSGTIKYIQAGEASTGNVYTATGTTQDKNYATAFKTDSTGKFTVQGLREREYHLIETAAPESYNKIPEADEQHVTVDPTLTDGKLAGLAATKIGSYITEVSADKVTGTVSITVVNHQGATLPTTGGIGTTIFYGIGGVLVLGALSLLIVRKRTTAK